MDKISSERRSWNMSRIRSGGTKPEMIVRQMVYALGYRYRLHVSKLPGKPDLVFTRLKKVIFVHGCFWHQHQDSKCRIVRVPKSSTEYWKPKLERNTTRDAAHIKAVTKLKWKVLVVWECQTADPGKLEKLLRRFLSP